MHTFEETLQVQNGKVTGEKQFRDEKRYLTTLRDGATYVRYDDPIQVGNIVVRILNTLEVPFARGIRYQNRIIPEASFVDLNLTDLMDTLMTAVKLSLEAAWLQKWTNLVIRPEAVGMILAKHQLKFNQDLTKSKILQIVFFHKFIQKVLLLILHILLVTQHSLLLKHFMMKIT